METTTCVAMIFKPCVLFSVDNNMMCDVDWYSYDYKYS